MKGQKGNYKMNGIKRVKYGNCPLLEVTYQLNFPTILSIEAEMPAKYQDKIRKEFPQYRMQTEREGEIIVDVGGDDANPVFRQRPVRKIHHFISEDGQWRLSLAKNQLSISTLQYDNWEDLKKKFSKPLKAFVDVYNQTYFERIGLEYIDAFNREKLNLKNVEWKELIEPHLLGCLGLQSNKSFKIKSSKLNTEIVMDDITVKIISGLGTVNKKENIINETFILDCEYSKVGKFGLYEIEEIATMLHQTSITFFRKAITQKLHMAMEPNDIEEN